jgi:hypothetical protein
MAAVPGPAVDAAWLPMRRDKGAKVGNFIIDKSAK